MIARAFMSAAGGIAATTGLLFVMQLLIASGEDIVVEPRVPTMLGLGKVREDRDVTTTPPIPTPPIKPVQPPPTVMPPPEGEAGPGIHIALSVPEPPTGGTAITGINKGDGPLFNIIKVSPDYPARAAAQGLEGTVLVQYDVTTAGLVVNVVVVESTHRVFEKAAIAAAYRFKYDPKTIDGVAYETKGLRNLFRFEMEE